MKHIRDERGVGLILEIVLVAVVLAMVGFAIYSSTQAKKSNDVKNQPTVSPATTPNITANWIKYSSSTGKFSFLHNPHWQIYTYAGEALKTCMKDRQDNILDIETRKSADPVITGCGDGVGQVHVSSLAGARNNTSALSVDATLYDNLTSRTVTVDGVQGKRYSGIAKQNLAQIVQGGTVVEYDFFSNGRNYAFTAEQYPSSNDITSDFDQMVKTVKFSQ